MKKFFLFLVLFMLYNRLVVTAQQPAGPSLALLPLPRQVTTGQGQCRLTNHFYVRVNGAPTDSMLYRAVNRTYQALNRISGLAFPQQYIVPSALGDSAVGDSVQLLVRVKQAAHMAIGVDESYRLRIEAHAIRLDAPTTIGALRGLQTLQQLAEKDADGFFFPCLTIGDAPRFPWRGLMIDVARHFIPLETLKRNIDAMYAVKLNVLHFHLSDDEGFRVESKLYPGLQQLGSNGQYYTQTQLKELVGYAADRGIVIVPEFDMPGHSQSWFAAYPGLASQPGPYHPGPRNQWQKEHTSQNNAPSQNIADMINNLVAPTFDPTNEKVYAFLDRFLGEMTAIFPGEYVHIGADENNGMAWKKNPAILAYMHDHHLDGIEALQRYFVGRVHDILTRHHRRMIGWEEVYYDRLPKDVIVHKWIPAGMGIIQPHGEANAIAAGGHAVLISDGFYLDVFMPAYIHYHNPAIQQAHDPNILGGEAAQWSEMADEENIEGRIWPRAGAIAERLWSPLQSDDADDMYRRLFVLSHALDEQGLEHISHYERALRRLTGEAGFVPLKTLTDVLTPVKGYRKLFALFFKPDPFKMQTTPLTAVSDIIFVDSEKKRIFRQCVKRWLQDRDTTTLQQLRQELLTWQRNDVLLQPLLSGDSRLTDIAQQSANLAIAAAIGLEALDRNGKDDAWRQQALTALGKMDKPVHETELSVLPEIKALVIGQLAAEPASFPAF